MLSEREERRPSTFEITGVIRGRCRRRLDTEFCFPTTSLDPRSEMQPAESDPDLRRGEMSRRLASAFQMSEVGADFAVAEVVNV